MLDMGCAGAGILTHAGGTKVIRLHYTPDLLGDARNIYSGQDFSLYQCNMEQPGFGKNLRGLIQDNQLEAFDLIRISGVLGQLTKPGLLLGVLRGFLTPGGRMMVAEAPLSGGLEKLLAGQGYSRIVREHPAADLEVCTCSREKDGPFTIHPMTEKYLDEVTELSSQCMGQNMYPRDFIASVMDKPRHFFHILLTPEGELAGYFYFFLTDLETVSAAAKLPVETMAAISDAEEPVIARFQALGIVPAFRNLGLARRLLILALEEVERAGADSAVAIAWKMDGFVPIADNLLGCGFQYLTDSHLVWYDMEDMICPYCKGRCKCDSAIYYKKLKGRD